MPEAGHARFALGTFSIAGGPTFAGLVMDDMVLAVRALNARADLIGGRIYGADSVLELLEDWDRNLEVLRRAAGLLKTGALADMWWAKAARVSDLKVHAPVEHPRQILMARANYREHVVEVLTAFGRGEGDTPEEKRANIEAMVDDNANNGDPFMWVKLASCVTGPFDEVELPPTTEQPDWELELAIVIGREARHVSEADAGDYIAGYCIANDLSSRDLIMRNYLGGQGHDWIAAKCSPGFMPLGPYLVPSEFVADPQDLSICLKHNGKVMQDAQTSDLLHSVKRLVSYASRHVQLLPGDVISTGSPDGNGIQHGVFIQPGDIVEGEITGLGHQRLTFRAAPEAN